MDGKINPIETFKSEPKRFKRTLEYGQFDHLNHQNDPKDAEGAKLYGLGIKIYIKGVNDIKIAEG